MSALVYYVAKSYHINVRFDGDPDLPGGPDNQIDGGAFNPPPTHTHTRNGLTTK